jgi:hypothetical protein
MTDTTQPNDLPDEELPPPSPERVAARALVMSTVTCRGFIEAEGRQAREFWARVSSWFGSLGLDSEIEPWERAVLETPLGRLKEKQLLDAQWQCEGLAVIAWALGCYDLPPYDQEAEASEAGNGLGFLEPRDKTVLAQPSLRPRSEIVQLKESLFSIHWRIREYLLRPASLDFAEFADTAWFGPLSLERVRLIDGDLALGEAPIFNYTPEEIQIYHSIVQERHRAANWLSGESLIYSETDMST